MQSGLSGVCPDCIGKIQFLPPAEGEGARKKGLLGKTSFVGEGK